MINSHFAFYSTLQVFFMKSLIVAKLFALSMLLVTYTNSHAAESYEECLNEFDVSDSESARQFWDFSGQIIQAFQAQDKELLRPLVNFPLIQGITESAFNTQPFKQLFKKEISDSIANSNPVCSYFSYDGGTLGEGMVWFDWLSSNPEKLTIYSMPASKIIELKQ